MDSHKHARALASALGCALDHMDALHPDRLSAERALEAFDTERLKAAECKFEDGLSELRELGCEPAMIRQASIAFRLYHALKTARTAATYKDQENANTDTAEVELPGVGVAWMAEAHEALEEFRETVANPDGL